MIFVNVTPFNQVKTQNGGDLGKKEATTGRSAWFNAER